MITARQYYDKALEVVRTFGSKVDPNDPDTRKRLLAVASYLQLAVNNSREPFPDASARLSVYVHALGQKQLARQHALTALRSRPHSFWARFTLFNLSCEELGNFNPYIDNSNLGMQIVTMGISMISVSNKKGNVRSTARDVALAYQETVRWDVLLRNDVDIESYVSMSEILLDIGDILRRTGLKETSVYQAILHVPWHCIKLGGFKEIVDDIRARAEGSLYI